MPSDETPESQPTKQIIVARFTQTACARKGQTVRTDSGTSYRLSKSDKPPCPAERRCEQLKEYTVGPTGCQPGILGFPQLPSGDFTPLFVIRCREVPSDSTKIQQKMNLEFTANPNPRGGADSAPRYRRRAYCRESAGNPNRWNLCL